jgi:glycosyltransferase involved in cell wall biosynthesis
MRGTRMMRVCFIVDSGTDVRLAEALAQRTSMRLIARRLPNGRHISQATSHPVDDEVGPAGHLAFAWFAFRRLLALRRDVDVVIVQGYGPTAAFANIAGWLIGCSVLMLVCSPVEAYYRCRKLGQSGRPFRRAEYVAIRFFGFLNAWVGHGYIVLSPYLASVVRAYGTRRPIAVIPVYGIDRELFRPAAEPKDAIRRRTGLPLDAPIVFFSSRVAPEKDAETVLRAVGLLADAGRPVFLLHRSGGHRELAALAEKLGVQQHVIAEDAVPPFEQLADLYRASDVCVQSSREEGLGFSPLEALACGVPVIATAVGGLNDTIRNGDTGWQVPPGDAEALAAAVIQVLDDPKESARRTARGADQVARLYDSRIVFNELLNLLVRTSGRAPKTSKAAVEQSAASEGS